MGAYLSKPVTEKHSSDDKRPGVCYGASSMQGWRVSQEDAHNAILDYDTNTHLFAVYDGHGGHEVSAYTALELPQVIKNIESYGQGQISQALTDSFLKFDATLVEPEVVAVLTQIASSKEDAAESDDSEEDVDDLYREATMPLAEVIAKYADNPQVARCKEKKQAASPFLKGKTSGEGSSSSSSSSSGSGTETTDEEKKPEIAASSSSSSSSSSSIPQASLNGTEEEVKKEEQEAEKVEEEKEKKAEINGTNADKHLTNGRKMENGDQADQTEGAEETREEEETEQHKKTEKTPQKDAEEEKNDAENTALVNGEAEQEENTSERPRKGKMKGGGGKGKGLLKNSKLVAIRERRAKEKRRQAAIKAAEIYRKIQEGGEEEEEEDEDEEDEDETFEDAGDIEDADAEESEEDEEEEEEEEEEDDDDDDEEEDGVEAEEDEDDPYTQFALNMKEEPGFDSGCTACVALLHGAELYVANVGDSRCVVCQDGTAIDMSLDHKPEDDPEANRIRNAGGRVTADGRVNGGLNLSRAIGDHGYKQNKTLSAEEQMISPLPDVRSMTLTPKDRFIIVACDGIWNSLSSQEACDFVAERLDRMEEDGSLSSICEELFDHCLAPDTHGDGTGCDNMTCIIIQLNGLVTSSKRPLQEEEEQEEGRKGEEEEEEGEGRPEGKKMKSE